MHINEECCKEKDIDLGFTEAGKQRHISESHENHEEGWRQVLAWGSCEQGGLLQLAWVISVISAFREHRAQIKFSTVSMFLNCTIESRLMGVCHRIRYFIEIISSKFLIL